MDAKALVEVLQSLVGLELAGELVTDFFKIRRDLATNTLERTSAGKFVECFVQCMQYISKGEYDRRPNVDQYLNKQVEVDPNLPDDLRVCAARIARAIYTLRNKRNIAHKGNVDPNTFDLFFCHAASSWIMSELLRHAAGITAQRAGEIISTLQIPIDRLVEEIDGTQVVLADVSVRCEILILLQRVYPQYMQMDEILNSLQRREKNSVRNRLRELYHQKITHGDSVQGYKLTQIGYAEAVDEIRRLTDRTA